MPLCKFEPLQVTNLGSLNEEFHIEIHPNKSPSREEIFTDVTLSTTPTQQNSSERNSEMATDWETRNQNEARRCMSCRNKRPVHLCLSDRRGTMDLHRRVIFRGNTIVSRPRDINIPQCTPQFQELHCTRCCTNSPC